VTQNEDQFIQPDHDSAPQQKADELFVHGLLGLLHDKNKQHQRIERVMAAISAPERRDAAASHRRLRVRSAVMVCAAMLVGALAVLLFMEMPSKSTMAYAAVTAARDAAKEPTERRYELRLAHWPDDQLPKDPSGTLDSGSGGFYLSFQAPDGHTVKVGKDSKGEWGIRLDGGIERDHPVWPRWVEVGDDVLLGDSMDHLLEGLLKEYALTSDGKQLLPGTHEGSKRYKHLHGDRKPGARKPQPDRVDLWIDSDTNVLERLEMEWPKPPPRPDGAPGPGKDGKPPRERRGDGPDGDQPPPRDGPGDRPMPDGPDGDRPPPPDGPDGDQPPPRDGPDGDRPPPRDGPRADRPPGPRPNDGSDRPRRRIDGPDGPRDGGPRNGGPPGPRPRVSRLILTRVDAPHFDEGWFSPEKHEGK
jgi:hypothetical protein